MALLLAGLLTLLVFVSVASAQNTGWVILFPLNMDTFPRVTTYLDVRDGQGYFISGLQTSNIILVENGLEIPPGDITELRPGAQVVLAVNPGDSFGINDGQGISRFDYVSAGIDGWLLQMGASNIDDLSVITPEGSPVRHDTNVNAVLTAWREYQPEFETASPTLDVLSRALDTAMDTPPVEGMGQVVLLLTPTLSEEFTAPLQSLADRAAQANIRIYVWVIDSESLFYAEKAASLRALAAQTGGQYFGFSGSEPLPDLNGMFESARRIYGLSYRSRINAAGTHQLEVRINSPALQFVTEPTTFDLQLQSPNPIFVSPPSQIVRSIPEDVRMEVENYAPNSQSLEIVVDFPDTIQREVVRTTLYVNNEVVAENIEAPFEFFELDISGYTDSERIFVSVEAEDELGLVGKSIETPIQITVQQPETGFLTVISRNLPIFAAGVALVAGITLFLVLVIAGRLRPRTLPERAQSRIALNDPVTQPLEQVQAQLIEPKTTPRPSRQQEIGRMGWMAKRFGRMPWSQPKAPTQSVAYLVPITSEGEPESGEVYPVEQREMVFGSEQGVSSIVIDDPSVEARHARLWQDADGVFHLADEKTIAGTWVNYAPVSSDGAVLQHGDLVHIAKRGYRFTLSNPVKRRVPVAKIVDEGEG